MPTKIIQLRAAAARGDWPTALRVAARFPRLGPRKRDIIRAHEILNGNADRFYAQLGHDPRELVDKGIEALRNTYKLCEVPTSATAHPAAPDGGSDTPVANGKHDGHRYRGRWRQRYETARAGTLPEPPDFSAPSHSRYTKKLEALVRLAEAGDVDGLMSVEIKPYSSSPRALLKYRDLCVLALSKQWA